ncbi:MAG: patatin-like phospholipase family protein [Elusimicrobiota bacterium]
MWFLRKRGIALGGGGARGLASLGVLKVLHKINKKPHIITGTSMGAIIGGLYAYYQNPFDVEEKVNETVKSPEFKCLTEEFTNNIKKISDEKDNIRAKFQRGYNRLYNLSKLTSGVNIIEKEYVDPVIDNLIPEVAIEDLPLKFCCVCTDLKTGTKVIIREGSLREAIKASSAVPGILPPRIVGDMFLTDGGTVSMVPVEEAVSLGASYVIAVEVLEKITKQDTFKNGLDIINRVTKISSLHLNKMIIEEADLVISPAVKNIRWNNFAKKDYCIKAGESAAYRLKDKIK